jgi:acyl-CoA thioesterase I
MKRIVCHGDSLTQGAEIKESDRWTTLVGNSLRVEVFNSGIGGDNSAGMLARLYPDVIRHKPDVVLVMGGTNDLWWDLPINMIQSNIYNMAVHAFHHDIAPVFCIPLPGFLEAARKASFMPPVAGYEHFENQLRRLRTELMETARRCEIPCIDFYSSFLDEGKKPRAEYFLEDGLHPNRNGHRVMAAAAAKFLRREFKKLEARWGDSSTARNSA